MVPNVVTVSVTGLSLEAGSAEVAPEEHPTAKSAKAAAPARAVAVLVWREIFTFTPLYASVVLRVNGV